MDASVIPNSIPGGKNTNSVLKHGII